jgi:GTPase SAR1 family protein
MDENKLSSVSKAHSDEKIGEFWDSHDFTEFDTAAPDAVFEINSTVAVQPTAGFLKTEASSNGRLVGISELIKQAKALPRERRKQILLSLPETELHGHLKELFGSMEPSYMVEVTHGAQEHGKDLVLVKHDKLTMDVIGVVVKRGSIKAKTLGDIEELEGRINLALTSGSEKKLREIESQIKQSFAHKAELRDFVETLPVNKVITIIAGEISKEGRARLDREINGPVETNGVDWLIENFTNFYPQVFFEGKLTDFLQNKIRELETRHRVIRSNKILSECFVEPVVTASDINRDFGQELRAIIHRKELPFSRLRNLMTPSRRIVLVGDPGTGKSAALAKLTIDLLRSVYGKAAKAEGKKDKTAIPLLASARDVLIRETTGELLEEYLGQIEIMDRVNVTVLFVDGLDEVSSAKRTEVIEKAKAFADEFGCGLLIASRKIDLLSITPAGFERFELQPFGAGQALQLIEKIHSNSDALTTLKNGLEHIRNQIPMVPLSLILLIEIVEEHKEIPASVTELYDRYHDSVLGRYDKEKGIEVLFEYLIKKRFLSELAFTAFSQKGIVEITRSDFDKFCDSYAQRYPIKEQLEKFIKEIERAGILFVGEETVLFNHRSFLDYFAAYYIFTSSDEFDDLNGLIVDIYFNDAWGETAFFYVGQKRRISEKLLDRILSYETESLSVYCQKSFVGHLLQAGWYSESEVKEKGIRRAVEFIPLIREKLYQVAERGKWPEPKIMVDALLLGAANYSLRSQFLVEEMTRVLDERMEMTDQRDISTEIYLLSVLRTFLTPDDFQQRVTRILDVISKNKNINASEKLRATLLLFVIKGSNKTLTKSIRNRLVKLRDRFPKEFKNLLPPAPTKKERFQPPLGRQK